VCARSLRDDDELSVMTRSRGVILIAALALLLLGSAVDVVLHDDSDGLAVLDEAHERMQARTVEVVELPPLRAPSENCDGLQRQLDIFKTVAPKDISRDIGLINLPKKEPLPPAVFSFLADHENGFDKILDATRCTTTKVQRLEIGREFRLGLTGTEHVLWRAELQAMPRLEPSACVRWCNEVLRAGLDDSPGDPMLPLLQERIVPPIEARLVDCAMAIDAPAATLAADDLARLLKAWPPFSTQIIGALLENVATLSYYYEKGTETKTPFHGLRAHLQFHRVLANDHVLLERPEAWLVVDSGSYQTRLAAFRKEMKTRDLQTIPFPDASLVSPGWDETVGTSNSTALAIESYLVAYLKVQAYVRMAYTQLLAPAGDLKDHLGDPFVQDPFSDSDAFHWNASKRSFYSVGVNGTDDGGASDDLLVVDDGT
jgi:hypothetical protein